MDKIIEINGLIAINYGSLINHVKISDFESDDNEK